MSRGPEQLAPHLAGRHNDPVLVTHGHCPFLLMDAGFITVRPFANNTSSGVMRTASPRASSSINAGSGTKHQIPCSQPVAALCDKIAARLLFSIQLPDFTRATPGFLGLHYYLI